MAIEDGFEFIKHIFNPVSSAISILGLPNEHSDLAQQLINSECRIEFLWLSEKVNAGKLGFYVTAINRQIKQES